MTWEEKILAMRAIGEISLYMREPGDWYVNHYGVEKTDGHVLSGGCVTDAKTPQAAVEKHWEWLVSDVDGNRIRTSHSNRAVRWNGFMWERVPASTESDLEERRRRA